MKFSYAQEFFLRGVAVMFIIMIAILFLTSCSNDKLIKCKEVAKLEYNLDNVFCRDCLISDTNCCCLGYVCKNKSCERLNINFYLKENIIKED